MVVGLNALRKSSIDEMPSAAAKPRRKDNSMNDFEIKAKIVGAGNSKVFKEWSKHSNITKEDFIAALRWLCADSMNEEGKITREIGLSPSGIVKLTRCYGKDGLCSFYKDGKLWDGELFGRIPKDEKESRFSDENGMIFEMHKICLSCKDRV